MAGKKVSFGTKPQKQPDVDAWVERRDAPKESEHEEGAVAPKKAPDATKSKAIATKQSEEETIEPATMKRLTLDIPETLHRRIKGRAVMEGVTMVNMLRKLLDETYG